MRLEMTSFTRRIVIGAFWSTADTWGRQAANFAVFTLLAWILGPDAYGLMGLALVVPTILMAPVTRGLPEAIVQRLEIDALHLDSAFWLLVGAGLILVAATIALAAPIALMFGEPRLAPLSCWASLMVLFGAIGAVPGAILKRDLHFRLFAVRSLISTLLGGTVGIGMALQGFGVWSLIGLYLTRSIAEALILLLGGTWKPRLRYSYARCQDLFGFARPVVVESFVRLINDETPKVVLGLFLGTYAVGIYTLARRLLDLLCDVLITPLSTLALPAIARMQDEPAKIDRFFEMTIRLTSLVGGPACVGLAMVAPDAVPFLFGQDWAPAVPVVQVMMVIGLQRTLDSICGATILALGHSMLLLQFHLAYAVMTPILVAIGAQFGLVPAIAGLVAGNVVLLPIFLVAVARLAGINLARALAIYPRVLAAAATMALAVTVWREVAAAWLTMPLLISTSVAIGTITYVLATLLVARRDLVATRDTLQVLRA
jgi:O-antigen/teichoic acid export membrane protein